MGTNPMRFRVESNKAKSSFWYTLVAGNGNTIMTSKAKYDDYGNALRAARNAAESLQSTDLIVEYERDGEQYEEFYPSAQVAAPASNGGEKKRARGKIELPVPSLVPFESQLNPQT